MPQLCTDPNLLQTVCFPICVCLEERESEPNYYLGSLASTSLGRMDLVPSLDKFKLREIGQCTGNQKDLYHLVNSMNHSDKHIL